VCLGYNISTGVAEHGVTTMRYIRIENKEQAEAIDRLEFGVSFEVGRSRKGASPLQPQGLNSQAAWALADILLRSCRRQAIFLYPGHAPNHLTGHRLP